MNEAALMGGIYENAYLTVSAARAADSSEGFLSQRPASVEVPEETTGVSLRISTSDMRRLTSHSANLMTMGAHMHHFSVAHGFIKSECYRADSCTSCRTKSFLNVEGTSIASAALFVDM